MIIKINTEKKEYNTSKLCLLHEEKDAKIFTIPNDKEREHVFSRGSAQVVFTGKIENKHELTYLFNTLFNSEETDAEFLYKLISHIGLKQTQVLVEGVYVAIYIENNTYQIFNDALGQYPLYYSFEGNNSFTAFTSVRNLPLDFKQDLQLKSKEELLKPVKEVDFAPFHHYKRLTAGKVIRFRYSHTKEVKDKRVEEIANNFFDRKLIVNSGSHFLEYLERRTQEIGKNSANHIAVPLSGGIDSGAVAALLNAQGKKIHSYSMGTEFSDEYVEAQQTADYLGTHHKTLVLTSDDVLSLMNELMHYNEIFDPLSVEILLPFGLMFKAAQQDGLQSMCTGYGSDLILGGTLKNIPSNQIFDSSVALIKRTFWTNEFSPFYSQHHGIDLYHPFWSNKLIHYGLHINADLKIKNEIEKYIFRTQIDKTALLPQNTVWRKKIGIHEGSSIKKLMLKAFNCNEHQLPDIIYHQYEKLVLKNELTTV